MRTFAPLRPLAALVVFLIALVSSSTPASAGLVDAIEYYNASLDHYFVTANADEINKLDTGFFQGWQRTNLSFKVYDAGTVLAGLVAVCRFYGSPAAGLDSHFYSASVTECDQVKQKFPGVWILESDNVFEVFLPDFTTGQCPANTIPVYRSWNNRADSNHRYTTDPLVQQAMIAKGYIAEGYGPPAMPTAMCSPSGTASTVPVCTPTASDSAPVVGTSITLNAHCTGSPTSYAWTGCASTTKNCTASSSTAGIVTYTVVATDASGNSAPASVSVNWSSAPPPPVCSLLTTANSDLPVVNSLVVLIASCSGSPSHFTWSNCVSTNNLCQVRSSMPGVQTYAVTASNGGGTSAPASASVNWQSSPAPAPDLCGQFPSFLLTNLGWGNVLVLSRDYTDLPAFAWNGVWAVKLTIPSNASTTATQPGLVSVAEYNGPPTAREVTISRFACDFRPNDPTGNNGPVTRTNSIGPLMYFAVGAPLQTYPVLTPGQTYYINVRNWQLETSQISCPQDLQRCDALVDVSLPR